MRIARTIYFIVSKSKPTEFYAGRGVMSEVFREAKIFDDQFDAEDEMLLMDDPDDYEILMGKIEVKI